MVQWNLGSLHRWLDAARSIWAWSASDRAWRILLGLAIALSLWPIARIDVFPSQDGPSHLYNASLLFRFHDPTYYLVRQ